MTTKEREYVHCPYCNVQTQVEVPPPDAEKSIRSICTSCHHPIAVYSSQARALHHTDRTVRAIAVEPWDFSDEPFYIEFVENQFAHPQRLRIPHGTSRTGRYNAHSATELQVFTNDPSLDRTHLRLWLKDDGTLLAQDAESSTGTYLNSTLLAPRVWARLTDGDVLTMGATTAIIHMPEEDDSYLFDL